MPSLFSLRESIAPDSFADAFPQNCPSSSPVPAKRTKSQRGARTDPERPRQADPARWAQAPAAYAGPGPSPPAAASPPPRGAHIARGAPGYPEQAPPASAGRRGSGASWGSFAGPRRLCDPDRRGGSGGQGAQGLSLSSPPLWQRLTQGWQAGRAARLHLASLPARQRSLAGSKRPRVALWQGKRVGTWLPE